MPTTRANDRRGCTAYAGASWTEPNMGTPCRANSNHATDTGLACGRKVEHPFRVLKCQWGYRKVRYRGLAKNTAQLWSLFGLANVYLARKKLMALA